MSIAEVGIVGAEARVGAEAVLVRAHREPAYFMDEVKVLENHFGFTIPIAKKTGGPCKKCICNLNTIKSAEGENKTPKFCCLAHTLEGPFKSSV